MGISKWLAATASISANQSYEHVLLKEVPAQRAEVLDALATAIQEAHSDAREHIRRLAGIDLSPLGNQPRVDPAEGYPELLPMTTLKGYLGEALAGFIAEDFGVLGKQGWQVPAFLFRFHQLAFDELECIRQTGSGKSAVVGRPGSDCLAFRLDGDGKITHCLLCEGKCTADHDSSLILDAHVSLSENPVSRPVGIRQVIEILRERDDSKSKRWVEALQRLWLSQNPPVGYERCDMVCYVCGRAPISQPSWIPNSAPHSKYTARRRLAAVEVHINDVEKLIEAVYGV